MNRFRNKKKTKDDIPPPRPSVESDSSSPFRMFGRKKSTDEEVKKEVDIAVALPSNDDFRTSLLMTGLSARFSMLREQDDPSSKIGKASDDSVLFPKRQSRMADFGFGGGLGDIAEVESIRGPGFARMDSFQSSDDGASTNTPSIMNRAKPLEGNSLFGGRQKVYKIPAGSKSGLPGRILYDDDVSQSAFQKWRQAEREREVSSFGDEEPTDLPESDSIVDFGRRRETNSTTSSMPSAARDSTAATSVMSGSQAPSIKDWLPSSNSSSTVNGGIDRPAMRTRRLYEQGLNQDLYDQQNSALSRIDTLSRQRNIGARTPDLSPGIPSPTNTNFNDRAFDRRPILAKSSAPNLRSFTPPTGSGLSLTSPPESSAKFPGLESRAGFGSVPPLSPPISETGDAPGLPAQSSERIKNVAALFNRPAQQYDEAKYAQRQRQMQQGRETPSSRFRGESNASQPASRSPSRSSIHRLPSEKVESPLKSEPTVNEEASSGTFFNDDDAVPEPASTVLPQLTFQETDSQIHPALRDSAPTGSSDDLPLAQHDSFTLPRTVMVPPKDTLQSRGASPTILTPPVDSPTLGPATTGLSGMVHQHLRNASTASSFYGPDPLESPGEPMQDRGRTSLLDLDEADWDMAHGKIDANARPDSGVRPDSESMGSLPANLLLPGTSYASQPELDSEVNEQDDFARHLADGARRVREKLNSYADPDSPMGTPRAGTPTDFGNKTNGSSLRSNALGILKPKSSRGSLIDRSREIREAPPPRSLPGQGIGAATMSTASNRTSPEPVRSQTPVDVLDERTEADQDSLAPKENIHAGLKAFRQARRELQKMKELEVQQRRQQGQSPETQSPPPARSGSAEDRNGPLRAPSQERGPPIAYNRYPTRTDSRAGNRSRSGSRAASERDRSGSDASNSGQNFSRPGRLRKGSSPIAENPGLTIHANGLPPRQPMLKSPGLPGTDIRRSPIMPPHPYPSASGSRSPYADRFDKPSLQQGGRLDAGMPSPMTLAPGPSYPHARSAPGTPDIMKHNGGQMRLPRAREPMDNQMYAPMNPYDQPSPEFRSLPNSSASTPNLGGASAAPPLPPINPRRKTMRSPYSDSTDEDMRVPMPPKSPVARERSPAPLMMTDGDGPESYRRMLRKVTNEANVPGRGRNMI